MRKFMNIVTEAATLTDWKVYLDDGTESHIMHVIAPDDEEAVKVALQQCEDKFGTSAWRVFWCKPKDAPEEPEGFKGQYDKYRHITG